MQNIPPSLIACARDTPNLPASSSKESPHISIILAGMRMPDNFGQEYVGQFDAIFPKVAAEQKTELIPFLLEGVGGVPKLNQADQIHPNVEGQKRVAQTGWQHLEKVLTERGDRPAE